MRKVIFLSMLLFLSHCVCAQTKKSKLSLPKNTVVSQTERKVLGKHMLALQWISWENFGICTITKDKNGQLRCKGEQRSKENDDFLKMEGKIIIVNANHLKFKGTISILVSSLNDGKIYKRSGTFNFRARGQRKYWRLQEMERSNAEYVDYVDIFFR